MEKAISISFEEIKMENALDGISAKTGAFFSYNSNLVSANQRFTLSVINTRLGDVLTKLLIGTGLEFKVVNDQIILYRDILVQPKPSYTLTGMVKERYTDEPVPGVNVFIAGTLKGGSTNLDGVYEIKDVDPGTFELAASHISYDITITKIEVKGSVFELRVNFTLNPKVNQLKELKVVSLKYKEWEKYFGIFKQEFLGSTQNASRCEILNPEVLDFIFNEEKKSIMVKAYKPLIIINTVLGYELNYYLEYFEIADGNTRSTGISNFKELEPKNDKERKRWSKNRLKSYQGSLTHFLKSLATSKVGEEGFKIYTLNNLPIKHDENGQKVSSNSLIEDSGKDGEKKIRFNNYLKVVYTKENESSAYVDDQIKRAMGFDPYVKSYYNSVRRGMSLGKQTSFMKLNFPVVTINSKGFFKESLAATTYGYWSWERLAESLPFEYEP